MQLIEEYAPRDGVALTCAAVGLARATFYRRRRPRSAPTGRPVSEAGVRHPHYALTLNGRPVSGTLTTHLP